MKKFYILFLSFLLASCYSVVQAITVTSIQSGPWTDAATWDCSCIPASENVIVESGDIVTINGTVTYGGSITIYGSIILNGILDGTGAKTIASGGILHDNGSIGGPGGLIVEIGGTLELNGNAGSSEINTTVQNHGTVNWNYGSINYYCSEGLFVNEASGTLNILGDASPRYWSRASLLNLGTVNKTSSAEIRFQNTGCPAPAPTFDNSGTVNVSAGHLLLSHNGTHSGIFNNSATLTFGGSQALTTSGNLTGAGAFNITGTTTTNVPYTFACNSVNLNGLLDGSGDRTIPSGCILHDNGSIGGPGGLIVEIGGTLELNGNAGSSEINTTVQNHGTVNWNYGSINYYCSEGLFVNEASGTLNILGDASPRYWSRASLLNLGTVNKTSSAEIRFQNTGCPAPAPTFDNSGTIQGIGTINIVHAFINSGTFSPGNATGELNLGIGNFPNNTLDIELASDAGPGTGHDRLNVSGNFFASGLLNVSLLGGYDPAVDTEFEIVSTTETVSGTFSLLNLPGGTDCWDVIYNSNSIVLVKIATSSTFYADADGDDFGDASQTAMACTAPSGYVSNDDDCDDTDENVNPNATEVCNDIDDDCDGQVDETTLGLSLAAGTIACAGGSTTLTATSSGGQPPYQYSLQSGPFAAQNTFTVVAGSYNVAVKDAHNCLVISSLTVNEPLPLTIPSVNMTHVTCAGGNTGAVNITVAGGTGPYTYQWSNNKTTEDIQFLAAGTYSVTVTDAHGCTATTAAIVNPKLKLVTSKTNVSCFGSSIGTATATVSGGTPPYSILWSNGEYTSTITGLAAGSYTVTVIDGYDCLRTATVTISQPAAIAVSGLRSNVSCFGFNDGEIDLAVSNGLQPFTYNWSDGATTEDRSDLTAGTYVVTVTDNSGCTGTKSFAISQPTQLAINFAVVNVSCNGSGTGRITLSVTGGTRYTTSNLCNGELYCYSWSNGATSRILNNLVAGVYNVTVSDKNGCVIFGSYTVTEPPILEITGIQELLLSNGMYKLTVTAAGGTSPYRYKRIPGPTSFQTSNIFNNVPVGNYQIVVRDNKLCTDTVEISVPGSSFLLAPSGAGTWSEIASELADADPSLQIDNGTENSTAVKGIRLFPNPAVKDVKLWVEKSFKEGEVLVFDVQGRLLIRQDLDANGVISLDVSPLKSGLYLVKVRLDGEYMTERLVITRN